MSSSAGKERHKSAAANLAQARAEAKVFGEERRREIRRRVQEHREQTAGTDEPTRVNDGQ